MAGVEEEDRLWAGNGGGSIGPLALGSTISAVGDGCWRAGRVCELFLGVGRMPFAPVRELDTHKADRARSSSSSRYRLGVRASTTGPPKTSLGALILAPPADVEVPASFCGVCRKASMTARRPFVTGVAAAETGGESEAVLRECEESPI